MLPSQSWSHEIRPAFLQIIQKDSDTYEVYWKVPRMRDVIPPIYPVFEEGIQLNRLMRPQKSIGASFSKYELVAEIPLEGTAIFIDGLKKTLIDVLVSVEYLNGERSTMMLQADQDTGLIKGTASTLQLAETYTVLGVEHILLGIDHLLFVLALLLICKRFKKLLGAITAFTLSHSFTLTLAVLGVIYIPTPPVEAVIALSIVFLAVELIKNLEGKESLTSKSPWLVAFTFGLLHGLGFASALHEVGLPQVEIPVALACFNIGVELGQIAFVSVMLAVFGLFNRLSNVSLMVKKIPAYMIGSVAFFWFIERIAAFC